MATQTQSMKITNAIQDAILFTGQPPVITTTLSADQYAALKRVKDTLQIIGYNPTMQTWELIPTPNILFSELTSTGGSMSFNTNTLYPETRINTLAPVVVQLPNNTANNTVASSS